MTGRLQKLSRLVSQAEGEVKVTERSLVSARQRKATATQKIETLEAASELLTAATEARREELRDRVEVLVTRGLRAVFNRPDYEFAFRVNLQRGYMGIVPVLRSDFMGKRLEDEIRDSRGGGVQDVVSFILRVVVLSLARPALAKVLVLDEAFRNVADAHLRGVATLLMELNRSAGVQFILVTHKASLLDAADVIYRAWLEDGETKFTLEHDLIDEDYHQAPSRERLREEEHRSAFQDTDLTRPVSGEPAEASGQAGIEQRRHVTRKKVQRKKRKRG